MDNIEKIQKIIHAFSHIIVAHDDLKMIEVKGKQIISFKIYLKDDSTLHIYQSLFLLKLKFKYNYYWFKADNTLIIGWDNAEHHHQVSTMPHHKHVGTQDNIQESEEMTLEKVLKYITKIIGFIGIVYGTIKFLAL